MSLRSPSEAELGPRLAERTLALCQIPSVTGEEEQITAHLLECFSAWPQYELSQVGKSLALRPAWTDRPRVALVGHVDTVPPHPGDPAAHVEGDRVVGLGSSDMKGGLAVMLALMEDLDPATLPLDTAWIFYDAEEGPYDQSGLGPLLAEVPWLGDLDLAFCLEPSDNVVQLGCVGTLHARVSFHGRSAHSARPWQGENAVHKAGAFLTELQGREPVEVEVGGHLFREVVSVTLASGGRARNVVPERFDLNLNYRFAPGRSLVSAQAEIEALVDGRAEVEFVDRSPAGKVVNDNPLYRRFSQLTQVEETAKQAWTDVARFAEAGIDAVNLGPGRSDQAHQAEEYVELSKLVASYQLFHRFLTAG